MSDYIKREDAIEFVESLVSTMSVCINKDECVGMNSMKKRAIGALHDVPAADVREVVYCQDCKWSNTDGMDDPAIYCVKWDKWEMPNDGFCWHGRRR